MVPDSFVVLRSSPTSIISANRHETFLRRVHIHVHVACFDRFGAETTIHSTLVCVDLCFSETGTADQHISSPTEYW